MKHLHLDLNYRLVIAFAFILLFTFVARAQDVPVDAPPGMEAPSVTSSENELIEATLKMLGLHTALAPIVTITVALLIRLPFTVGIGAGRLAVGTSIVYAVIFFVARRAGLEVQLQSIFDVIINSFIPWVTLLFAGSGLHEASARIGVPILGYKRGSPATSARG